MQTQKPEDQKNLIAAIVLSVGVLLAWQYFYAGPKMKEEQERQRRLATERQTSAPAQPGVGGGQAPVAPGTVAAPGSIAAPGAGVQAGADRAAAVTSTKRAAIATPSLKGSINLTGARIDDITLVEYHETIDPKSPNVVVFSPASAPAPYFAEYGWVAAVGTTAKLPDKSTVWDVDGNATLTPEAPVKLVWKNGEGLTFRRTISVDRDFMFSMVDEVDNGSATPITLYPYARIFRYGTPHLEGFAIQHEGLIGVLGAQGLAEITYADARKDDGGKIIDKVTGGWLGFTDKYWAAALIPDQSKVYKAQLISTVKKPLPGSKESFQADYLMAPIEIKPQTKGSVEGRLFVGAKKVAVVEAYHETQKIKQFELLIDWGWFYFITKPLYHLISWLYKILGNFGLAILTVTVLVKAAFFWFANKSYESMAKMKKLQPDMERIRDRYKDDKGRQQQELMELYKKEKINPLAGCLPILVQIPVFFALYKVIFVSIDMRHAPFFGWIRDLSAPDPTSIFNLFGLLPFAVPEFLHIGAWAVVMGMTMWVQMQLNPKQPDPVQQQVFNWMPVMFTFMLARFPSGLVIYWTWNNILSVLQQYFIMRRQGVDVPLGDNVKQAFGSLKQGVASLLGRKK